MQNSTNLKRGHQKFKNRQKDLQVLKQTFPSDISN